MEEPPNQRNPNLFFSKPHLKRTPMGRGVGPTVRRSGWERPAPRSPLPAPRLRRVQLQLQRHVHGLRGQGAQLGVPVAAAAIQLAVVGQDQRVLPHLSYSVALEKKGTLFWEDHVSGAATKKKRGKKGATEQLSHVMSKKHVRTHTHTRFNSLC